MPHTIEHLRLELDFPEPGHTSPTIALLDRSGSELGRILASEPLPCLPLGSGTVRAVEALDVLEHVHDEQVWLAEIARILVAHGELVVRVPLENLLAWADALNVYRYISDVTGLGTHPLESLPTGWHRHYAPDDLPALLELAGFEPDSTSTQGLPLQEIPHLAGLIAGKIIRGDYGSERRLFRFRQRFQGRPRLPLPVSIAATITVRARRSGSAYQPDPDLDANHRPELEADSPLE